MTFAESLKDQTSNRQLSAHFVRQGTEPAYSRNPVLSQGGEIAKVEARPSNGSAVDVDEVVSCARNIKMYFYTENYDSTTA